MMKFKFDGQLKGANGELIPVYCEVEPPTVGGQKASVKIKVPAQYSTRKPPENPCEISGQHGDFRIRLHELSWRTFPVTMNSNIEPQEIELLFIKNLSIKRTTTVSRKEIRFHIAPLSYLRAESGLVHFGDRTSFEELFTIDLPGLGDTIFAAEWATIYHRKTETPGATVIAGFCAIASLKSQKTTDESQLVACFKDSIEVLSILFRQAITLHGWTYEADQTSSVWISPLQPNVTPSSRENRGEFIVRPNEFADSASKLAHAYSSTEKKTRSLVRHLCAAINPYNNIRAKEHFLFMFSTLERAVELAWTQGDKKRSSAPTDTQLIAQLEKLKNENLSKGDEDSKAIADRLSGIANILNRPSIREKFDAFFHAYPTMKAYSSDLWPILGSDKDRGLREIRNALSHGRGSSIPLDVVVVAEWHLGILLERLVFVLLGLPLPDGLTPGSPGVRMGGRGWYEYERWEPLRRKPDEPI